MPTIYFDQTHLSHSLQFVPDPPLHHPPNFMFSFYVPLSPISVGFKCMGVGPFSGATFLGSHPSWKLTLMSLAVVSCQMLLSWGWGLMCPFRSILECWLVSCAGNGSTCELTDAVVLPYAGVTILSRSSLTSCTEKTLAVFTTISSVVSFCVSLHTLHRELLMRSESCAILWAWR